MAKSSVNLAQKPLNAMSTSKLEIVPGLKSEPLFPNAGDYEKFKERYIAQVTPELARLQRARDLSEHESRNRIVD